jgi:hypothetical protein
MERGAGEPLLLLHGIFVESRAWAIHGSPAGQVESGHRPRFALAREVQNLRQGMTAPTALRSPDYGAPHNPRVDTAVQGRGDSAYTLPRRDRLERLAELPQRPLVAVREHALGELANRGLPLGPVRVAQ